MIDLKYSLIIEATIDPNFFGFYSADLEGFTGVGNSIEDGLYKALGGDGGARRVVARTWLAGTGSLRRPENNDSKR